MIYLWSQVCLQIHSSRELASLFLNSPGPFESIGISDGHHGGSVSLSTLMALHPGFPGWTLHVPDPLHFRVNGQVIVSFQSQEVKKAMGGPSIPNKLCWWSQWIEKCPFAGGLEDAPSGKAGVEFASVFRRSLSASPLPS